MSRQKCFSSTKMIFAIILLLLVDQGLSLKCYICDSGKDGECMKELKEEQKKDCSEEMKPQPTTVATETTPTTVATETTPTTPTTPTTVATETTPTTPTTQKTDDSKGPNSTNSQSSESTGPRKQRSIFRVRRQSEPTSRAEDKYICYKYEYEDDKKEVKTKRGCAKEGDFDCKDRKECKTCTEDGCNSASLANLGIVSIILPIVFTSLNR